MTRTLLNYITGLVLLCGLIQSIMAQGTAYSFKGRIQGNVLDATSLTPIEFATVRLFKNESSFNDAYSSDSKGQFSFEITEPGSYYLLIEYIGYEVYKSSNIPLNSDQKTINFGNVLIKIKSQILNEVLIRSDKNLIQHFLDKKVFNVSKDLISTGGDALNVLERLPAVDVDMDGKVSLKGNDNVRILLDGRPTNLSQTEFLKQISASSIDQIELISNPSANYDPEGMAGIINIVLKKSDNPGLNGSLNSGYTQAYFPRFNGSLQLNHRTKQYNFLIDYGNNINNQVSTNVGYKNVYTSPQYKFLSDGENQNQTKSHLIKTSFDYYLPHQNSIYSSASFQYRDINTNGDYLYNYLDAQQNNYQSDQRINTGQGIGHNFDLNAGWLKRSTNPKKNITLDILLKRSQLKNSNYYLQTSSINPLIDEKDDINEIGNNASIKLDVSYPLSDKTFIETGFKSNALKIDHDYSLAIKDELHPIYINDPNKSNHFIYKEWTQAVYFTYSKTIGKFSAKFGLRPEFSTISSELKADTLPEIKTNYFSLFPSFNSSYKYSESDQFVFSITRRINRPGTEQLNPFVNASDPFSLRSGNPFIKPEYAFQFDLAYNRQIAWGSINPSIYYRRLNQLFGRKIQLDTLTAISKVEFINYPGQHTFGIDINANLSPFPWIKSTWNVNYNRSKLIPGELSYEVNEIVENFSGSLNLQFPLKNGINIQMNSKYRATQLVFQGKINFGSNLDLAVGKSFLKNSLNLTIKLTDVFNTRFFKFRSTNQEYFYSESERRNDSRTLGLFLAYKFGKNDPSKPIKKEPEEKQQERMDF